MNLHPKHKIVKIEDEDTLTKENLTINSSTEDFNNNIQKLTDLKNKIENEMIKIDKAYEKADNETTKSYESKIAKLKEEEENLKDKLKIEVTKIKELLENNLSQVNQLIKSCEKIQKGIQSLEKEEKNMIKNLTYISKINTNKKEMDILLNSSMKNLDIHFSEKESKIDYNEYYFNGFPLEQVKNKKIEPPKPNLKPAIRKNSFG